ncbi:hypothetical protein C4J81_11840 [Deltaproteobacteria bacterium Smac51]|nr:hypothetical protein C4J81_11840 [Deltaproteobacteria bacterium Smac51]
MPHRASLVRTTHTRERFMRRFEFKDLKSDKFWEIERTGRTVTTRWGRIGTNGQSKSKDFSDEAAAEASVQKQIDEKTSKGYEEATVSAGSVMPPAPIAARPAKSLPSQQAEAVVEAIADDTAPPVETPAVTTDGSLPEMLLNPPWTQKKVTKKIETFKLDPLPLEPVVDMASLAELCGPGFKPGAADQPALNPADIEGILYRIGLEPDKYRCISKELNLKALQAVKKGDAESFLSVFDEIFAAVEARKKADDRYWFTCYTNCQYLSRLPEAFCVPVFNKFVPKFDYVYHQEHMAAKFGLAILPGLMELFKRVPSEHIDAVSCFGTIELAPVMARAFFKLKSLREQGRQWLLGYPRHAASALIAPALGPKGEAADCAAAALRLLNRKGHHDLIMETAALYQNPQIMEALEHLISGSELDLYPSRIPSLPSWWQAEQWRAPLIANGPDKGRALPLNALNNIGVMLSFPNAEGWYAGLEVVKSLCTKLSLANFAWDIFMAWQNAGTPSKDKWAFLSLGFFGDDETARRLTPCIREWPGMSAHARAVTGLEVLAAIGTDVALMQLNGIAQKVKFKGLQDKAREMIQRIADDMGLSTEQLEDRLAPDFGLDEQGAMILDYGPRQFTIGFDEALKPYVREQGGKRLNNLPRPAKTDDPDLSAAASELFKNLKKDVRTVAAQQIMRLEMAMCRRRHWNREHFETFLVRHPLIRHLTQRLVWAFYPMEPDAKGHVSNFGGQAENFFRVSEDGSFTDAEDNPFELPDNSNLRLGIPHIMEMTPEALEGFGQLFADYELIQPFVQLGREVYSLNEDEKDSKKLSRWRDIELSTGRVFGLRHRGWRMGTPQDGGWVGWMHKSVDEENHVRLHMAEGFSVGYTEMTEPQKIEFLEIGRMNQWEDIKEPLPLSAVDPMVISELIREMEMLTKKADF